MAGTASGVENAGLEHMRMTTKYIAAVVSALWRIVNGCGLNK